MKILMLSDADAESVYAALFVGSDHLDKLAERVRVQLDDPLLGAPGERTILIRQGTPPLLMANFDDPADAEAVWKQMASSEGDRLSLAPDVVEEGDIAWPT